MSINNLNPNTFHENLEERIRLIDAASPEIKDDFYLNRMAKVFHPDRQYMKIDINHVIFDLELRRLLL